ncbi:MAG: hypothetical protein J2P17_11110 [Mycobacterium sp.]|nr:hypothetical protein [Mycobacterium sp.]
MTNDMGIPSVSAEAIRDAFIADAAADTELVVRVSGLLSTFGELKERIEATYKDLVDAYLAAEGRPNAAAKLVELGFPRPDDLGVDVGGLRRNSNGKRGARGRRRARSGPGGTQQTDGHQQPEQGEGAAPTASAPVAEGGSEVDAGGR